MLVRVKIRSGINNIEKQHTYMSKNTVEVKNSYKGKNVTPAGILPPDMLVRHKIKPEHNTPGDASTVKRYYHNRKAHKLFRLVKTYRQLVHKCHEPRLSRSLRLATHYLMEPMSRSYSNEGVENHTADVQSASAS